jgi:hypothetical protein
MHSKFNLSVLLAVASFTGSILAQSSGSGSNSVAAGQVIAGGGPGISMHLEDRMDVAPVKGSPFCASVSTEHTQNFADGNRIHSIDNSSVCRDSEGRTRRDAGLNLLPAGPRDSAPKLITIVDPVAGVRYLLDTENKIAHKAPLPPPGSSPESALKGQRMLVLQSAEPGPPQAFSTNMFYKRMTAKDDSEPAPTTENLGDQTINGIRATGTRITTTIPAGKMGNDQPINVVSERWFSSDLKATVMSKHEDPWAGELKTQFTGVNTSEPDSSLFTVPSDYKIVDDKNGPVTIRMAAPLPPPPQ